MSFTDIKTKSQGFTIVELLIVVVVIAILAAITIVSYNGITNRANASAAASLASGFQKKAELFVADGPTGAYPRNISDLTGSAAILSNPALSPAVTTNSSNTWYTAPGSISSSTSNPTSSNGKTTIRYNVCGHNGTATAAANIAAMTTIVGAQIIYYDFEAGGTATKTISLGSTTTGGNPNVTCPAS